MAADTYADIYEKPGVPYSLTADIYSSTAIGGATPTVETASVVNPPVGGAVAPVLFTPADLFVGGFTGGFWDFTDAVTLFSDVAGTTPATLNGKVQRVNDKSGNGRNITTALTTILRRTNSVEFPGSGIGFATASGQTGSAAGWTSCVGVRLDTPLLVAQWVDADWSGARIGQVQWTDTSTGTLGFLSGGPKTLVGGAPNPVAVLTNYTLTALFGTTSLTQRVNGVQTVQLTYGAGVPDSSVGGFIGIGSGWLGTAVQNQRPVDGWMYAAVFINKLLNPTETANLETWMAAKMVGGP